MTKIHEHKCYCSQFDYCYPDDVAELEKLAEKLHKALVNLNNDASAEIAEYQVPSDVREALDEYERIAAMPNVES